MKAIQLPLVTVFPELKDREKRNYKEFLQSNYWQSVSQAVKDRDKCCIQCGTTRGLNAHHKKYIKRGTEHNRLDCLVTLCSKCHKKEHIMEWLTKKAIVANEMLEIGHPALLAVEENSPAASEINSLLLYQCFNELKILEKIPDYLTMSVDVTSLSLQFFHQFQDYDDDEADEFGWDYGSRAFPHSESEFLDPAD